MSSQRLFMQIQEQTLCRFISLFITLILGNIYSLFQYFVMYFAYFISMFVSELCQIIIICIDFRRK